ncbi:MAG: DUF5667 domain-containing protein [Candidatus Pacebacteria bacterium]|nr:DUF5667 domain-containing protein [Candidatus Paceibacterota bacterium]
MKNNHIKNTIVEIKKISLTHQEKSALFDVLDWYAESNPSVKSPYSISTWTHQLSRPLTYVLTSLLIVLLAGGSSVFASEGALPGDILYPIKIHVSEPLKVALATSLEAKQQVKVAQVEERLKEAETLAVQGRLTSSTSIEIQQAVAMRVSDVHDSLSDKNKNHLEVTLAAHENVLESIKKHSSDSEKTNIENVQIALRQDTEVASASSVSSIMFAAKVAPMRSAKINPSASTAFSERKDKVQKAIQDVDQKIHNNSKNNDSADSFEQSILNTASSSIQNAQTKLNQAEDNHSNNNDDEANALIDVSEKKVQEASISIDRGLELGKLKWSNRGNK